MKLFLLQDVGQLTSHYHGGGGLVVVAESLEDMLAQLRFHKDVKITADELGSVKIFELAGEDEKQVYVFPDAGCC